MTQLSAVAVEAKFDRSFSTMQMGGPGCSVANEHSGVRNLVVHASVGNDGTIQTDIQEQGVSPYDHLKVKNREFGQDGVRIESGLGLTRISVREI